MWWAVGLYFFVGLLAAIGIYDRRDYERWSIAALTIFLWPMLIGRSR